MTGIVLVATDPSPVPDRPAELFSRLGFAYCRSSLATVPTPPTREIEDHDIG